MISPLALVSVWAALKLKLITWHHLCVWIALFEVRAWRDSMEPEQRNIFTFSTKRVAQALGKIKAGPRLKKALAELEELRLARLAPTEIYFTPSLDALPADLRAETERMLGSLGTRNISRAMRMPRRLMRLIMKSRARPLRAAVIFGILLRIMPVKRYGRYKGCLTTALLVDVSGFNESRIKHERASLVREGCFERLDTPFRVRQQHGYWYALPHEIPVFSGPKITTKRQSSALPQQTNQQPPIKEPAPSFGIETNQHLPKNPGASRSIVTPETAEVATWSCMTEKDLEEPGRRSALYGAARQKGVIGAAPADRLTFYSAMARARRLGSINPCGMFRRIVETPAYHVYIADCDEDRARAWLREMEPQPQPAILALATPQAAVASGPSDVEVYRAIALDLMSQGHDPNGREAYDIVRREVKSNVLKGWTRDRWEAARAEALGQRLRPETRHHRRGEPGNQ